MIYILFLFITFVVLMFVFYQWQYFMIFSPTYYREEDLDDEFEILSITTDDGVELEGVVYEPRGLYRKLPTIESTLLFFPGRSHDVVGLIKKLSIHYPHVRIITFNYRSYGRSEGSASEKNILNDGVKIAELVQKNYGDFYILGYSIGSNVASYVASKIKCKGLFLVGAFDSMANIAKEKYFFNMSIHRLGLASIFRYKFDNIQHVKSVDAKTYLIASKNDEEIYIKNTRNLKQHVKNLALYEEYEDLTHQELLWDEKVVDKITGVLK